MVMLAWVTPLHLPLHLLALSVWLRAPGSSGAAQIPRKHQHKCLELGRHLCDSTCPGYLQPSTSKGCKAAHKFVAKRIFVIQDFWGGKNLSYIQVIIATALGVLQGKRTQGATSKVSPALQKGNQRLLDKAPGQQPHFLHWTGLWATRPTWNRNWRLLGYVGFVRILLLPLRGFAFSALFHLHQVDAERMQRGVCRGHKLL